MMRCVSTVSTSCGSSTAPTTRKLFSRAVGAEVESEVALSGSTWVGAAFVVPSCCRYFASPSFSVLSNSFSTRFVGTGEREVTAHLLRRAGLAFYSIRMRYPPHALVATCLRSHRPYGICSPVTNRRRASSSFCSRRTSLQLGRPLGRSERSSNRANHWAQLRASYEPYGSARLTLLDRRPPWLRSHRRLADPAPFTKRHLRCSCPAERRLALD
jgi:hypothetical protein